MSYEAWERGVPEHLRADPLWTLRVYRLALYAGELGRRDSARLARVPMCGHLADQLRRATDSISSNIAEGYGRESMKDRARYYEYAVGSARESRDWYYKARASLGPDATESRLSLHTSIVRIMTTLATRHRQAKQ